MEDKIAADLEFYVDDVNKAEPVSRQKTRGQMLVLVCVIAIVVVSLSKLLMSAWRSDLGVWSTYLYGFEQSITSSVTGLLCVWLAWRPTKWLSWGKVVVMGLLVASVIIPKLSDLFSFMFSNNFTEYQTFVVAMLMLLALLAFEVVGLDFAGRFLRLQLVERNERAEPRRLTIRSYFLLTLFLSIPLTFEFWLRRSQLTNTSSNYIDTSTIHYWFGGLVCEILFFMLMAMMFAVNRDKRRPLVAGLLIVLLLKGAISWSLQKSYFTEADLSDPTFMSSYRELWTISAITYVGELALLPFGFWLIQSSGYDLRIVKSTEIRQPELDGLHPLE